MHEAKYQKVEQILTQTNKFVLQIQESVEDERRSIIEGMNEVRKKCYETIQTLNTEQCPAIKDTTELNQGKHISELTLQKSQIETDIALLEKAKEEKAFKPVESLLKDVDIIPLTLSSSIDDAGKNQWMYSWNGELCSPEGIVTKAENGLKTAFYAPLSKILGKRNNRGAYYSTPIKSGLENENKIKKIEKELIKSNKIKKETLKPILLKDSTEAKKEKIEVIEAPKIMQTTNFITVELPSLKGNKMNFELPLLDSELAPVVAIPISEIETGECYCVKPATAELFIYDARLLTSKKYKTKPNSIKLPLNFAMCVHQQKLHISGGDKENGFTQINNVYNVNITDSFFNLNEMKGMLFVKRQHTMLSAENKFLFIIGGFDASSKEHLKVCERYDDRSGWARMPDISTERRGVTGVYLSNFVYVFGGSCDSTLNIFERLDISSCTSWELLNVNFGPFNQRFLAAGIAISKKEMLLFGGYEKDAKNDACIVNVETMSVRKVADMMQGDYFYQRACTVFTKFVFIAGQEKPIVIHSFDINAEKWALHILE